MIKLDIPDFCHNCQEFEPDVDKNTLKGDNFLGRCKTLVDTTVSQFN